MPNTQNLSLFILRITLGWMYFYAGITKVINPEWSAAGYLKGAKMFTGLYGSLTGEAVLPIVNFVNEWGLVLLGVSLVTGAFIRFSAPLGILLMVLYWLALGLPMPNTHSYIVDEHIIYSAALFVLWAYEAGKTWGFGHRFR